MKFRFSLLFICLLGCCGFKGCGDESASNKKEEPNDWPTESQDGYPIEGDAILFARHEDGREFVIGCTQFHLGLPVQDVRANLDADRCDCDPEERFRETQLEGGDILMVINCSAPVGEDGRASHIIQGGAALSVDRDIAERGIIPGDYDVGDLAVQGMDVHYGNVLGKGYDGGWSSYYTRGSTDTDAGANNSIIMEFDEEMRAHITDREFVWSNPPDQPTWVSIFRYHSGWIEGEAYSQESEENVHIRVEFSVERALELFEKRQEEAEQN